MGRSLSIGSRGSPFNIQLRVANAATNFSMADRGGSVVKNDISTPLWTILADANEAWDGDVSINCSNFGSSGNVTIAPETGVTLTAGTTAGNFSLLPGESRLLQRTAPNTWRLS